MARTPVAFELFMTVYQGMPSSVSIVLGGINSQVVLKNFFSHFK